MPLASCNLINEESNEQIEVFEIFFIFETVQLLKMNFHPTVGKNINIVVQDSAECFLFINYFGVFDGCVKCHKHSWDRHPSAVSPLHHPLYIGRAGTLLSLLSILGTSKCPLLEILTSRTG